MCSTELVQGMRVCVIKDATGIDLPRSMIGRYGILISRNEYMDEAGKEAWNVLIDGYRKNRVFWEDELRPIYKYKGE